MSIDLTPRLRLAADYIADHGWTQGKMQDDAGRVCLTGAIRLCAPRDGDEEIIRVVLRAKHCDEVWNDNTSTTKEDVLDLLRSTDITDDDLAHTFGPQWEAIVALIRRCAALTESEAVALDAVMDAAWAAAVGGARVAARDAAWAAARATTLPAAVDAAWDAWDAAATTRDAAWDAMRALVVRDLITDDGFTQAHYDLLVGPWSEVIGKVHPDDTTVTA